MMNPYRYGKDAKPRRKPLSPSVRDPRLMLWLSMSILRSLVVLQAIAP